MELTGLRRARHLVATGKIRAMREAAGLSQSGLADKLNVKPATISHWETGRRKPTDDAALRLTDTLDALTAAATSTEIRGLGLEEQDRRAEGFELKVSGAMHRMTEEALDGWDGNPDELSARMRKAWNRIVDNELIGDVRDAWVDSADATRKQVKAVVDRVLVGTAAEILTSLEPGSHGVRNLKAERHLQEARNRLRHVPDEYWGSTRERLEIGIMRGESIPELSGGVQDQLGPYGSPTRATTIARTEVISASNAGSQAMMDETGMPYRKRWVATHDGRTRPSHLAADGQEVDQTETYDVGGSQLRYPGDPAGRAEEIINCRCTEAHILAEEDVIDSYFDEDELVGEQAMEQYGSLIQRELTDAERQAIGAYQGIGYHAINGGLRSGEVPNSYVKEINTLKELGAVHRTIQKTVLYRGLNDSRSLFPENAVGAVIQDKAFMSVSTSRRVSEGFTGSRMSGTPTMVEIRIPKGTSTIPVDWALGGPGGKPKLWEQEVILMPGTQLKITSDTMQTAESGKQMRYLTAEVVT